MLQLVVIFTFLEDYLLQYYRKAGWESLNPHTLFQSAKIAPKSKLWIYVYYIIHNTS